MCKHREFKKKIRKKGRRERVGVEREKERERSYLSCMYMFM